jgi:hypothetical protein
MVATAKKDSAKEDQKGTGDLRVKSGQRQGHLFCQSSQRFTKLSASRDRNRPNETPSAPEDRPPYLAKKQRNVKQPHGRLGKFQEESGEEILRGI